MCGQVSICSAVHAHPKVHTMRMQCGLAWPIRISYKVMLMRQLHINHINTDGTDVLPSNYDVLDNTQQLISLAESCLAVQRNRWIVPTVSPV